MEHLLNAGADKYKQEKGGLTPLFFAAMHGHIEIVRKLLNAGADKDFKLKMVYQP